MDEVGTKILKVFEPFVKTNTQVKIAPRHWVSQTRPVFSYFESSRERRVQSDPTGLMVRLRMV